MERGEPRSRWRGAVNDGDDTRPRLRSPSSLFGARAGYASPAPNAENVSRESDSELIWWRLDKALDLEMRRVVRQAPARSKRSSGGRRPSIDHHASPTVHRNGSLSVIADACAGNRRALVDVRIRSDGPQRPRGSESGPRREQTRVSFKQAAAASMSCAWHACFTLSDDTLDAVCEPSRP